MSWPNDIAEGFPQRHDRELRRSDDQATARSAVLERFGDPTRIARKLWFDAMKETVMKDRVMMIAASLMAVACIGLTLLVMSALRQDRAINEAILAKLNALGSAEPSKVDLEWGAATLRLVNSPGKDGSLSGIKVELIGNAINPSEGAVLDAVTNSAGLVEFRPIRPGTFKLRVYGEGGLWHERLIVVMPGGEQNEQLVWPGAFPLVDVSFEIDWPQDLRDMNLLLHCNLEPNNRVLDLEGAKWNVPGQVRFGLSANGKVLGQINSRPGERVRARQHPSRWEEFPATTSVSDTLRITPQFYNLTSAKVYPASDGSKPDTQYAPSQSAVDVEWTDLRWPTYEASSNGSGNRWRITDWTIREPRRSPALAQAFLNERVVASGYGAVLHKLALTKVAGATHFHKDGKNAWRRRSRGQVSIANDQNGAWMLFCRWATVLSHDATNRRHRFLLALSATKTKGTTTDRVQLLDVLESWDEDDAADGGQPPRVSTEPVAEYDFEPGDGWKLFDVTKLVRARVARGGENFGIMLRFADSQKQVLYRFEGRNTSSGLAPFRPVLLVVEAGPDSE